MPIIKSAKKAARQATKRTAHNQDIKKDIKAAMRDFKANPTVAALAKAQSELDKAVKKNLLKKNTASRRKSSLAKIAKEAGLKFEKLEKDAVQEVEKAEKKVKKVVKAAVEAAK